MNPGRRRQGSNFALFLLASQLFRVGFDRIPPVTLATIIGQVVTFLRLLDIDWPSIQDVCVSSAYVWHYGDWKRLLFASFFHVDDWHLYYNMVSFLWKGLTLERTYGSAYFAFIIAVFSVLCNVVLVGLNIVVGEFILADSSYLMQCAAGFSAVIFALKVLTTHLLPSGVSYIMGWIPVPSRYAVWAELVVIQLLVPRASFTGHLAGIIVGLLYVKGPLGTIMETLFSAITGFTLGTGPARSEYTHRTYYNQSGASGYAQHQRNPWHDPPSSGRRPEPTAPPDYDHDPPQYGGHGSRLYPDLNAPNPPYPRDDHQGMPYPQAPDYDRMRRSRLNRFDNVYQ